MAVADADIGDVPCKAGTFVAGVVLKYRFDIGRIAVDLRNHDEDILAAEIGIAVEQCQQVIVQYLAFAHRTMTQVHGNRVIDDPLLRWGFQVKQAVLQGL